jgi:hypothetical protein
MKDFFGNELPKFTIENWVKDNYESSKYELDKLVIPNDVKVQWLPENVDRNNQLIEMWEIKTKFWKTQLDNLNTK